MKPRRQQGLTLIEMLVAIAVMGVVMAAAYATVRDAMKLHQDLQAQATWIVDRCALAEQLTSDFRANRGAQQLGNGNWSLTRADGTEAVYEREKDLVVRVLASNSRGRKVYSVGKVEAFFPSSEAGKLLRLQFSNTELIFAR
jgi:prepilin-type N-terminal cleavage/methylation domain-containing protein